MGVGWWSEAQGACEAAERGSNPISSPVDYFFLLGRCARADAAADLADLPELGLASVLPAAEAALRPVTSLALYCVNAEAAADFAEALVLLLANTLPAADTALLPVFFVFDLAIKTSIDD